MSRWASDVVVVGGGPVGLAAAMYAVGSGLSVVVLEPRQGAIDKACGEGLMPGGVGALATLGVDPVGWDLVGIRYVWRWRQA
jgi:2-polyprenyl-6-methoxyphenol hydroxylase-like FAD-dependent oxidoreductase